jgi:hypothetical protein
MFLLCYNLLGIRYLADPLTENTSILHLDLRNNGIHDDDIVDLAKALEKNKTLQLLDLRWNLVMKLIIYLKNDATNFKLLYYIVNRQRCGNVLLSYYESCPTFNHSFFG